MLEDGDASGRRAALRLAELLATRMCHDFSGPISGLSAALGEAEADAEALPLALEAAAALRRRLALLRAAWGAAPPALSGAALHSLAEGLPNAHRLRLLFDARVRAATFAPAAARLAVNLLLLAAESLPSGGSVALAGDPAAELMASIAGPRAAWPEGLGLLLADPAAAWAVVAEAEGAAPPRRLQAAITALLADAAGAHACLLLGPDTEAPPPLLLRLPAAG